MSTMPPSDPPAPATRSKAMAGTALALAIGSILLSVVGFFPVPWLGLIAAILAGVLALAAFIVAILALVGKRHGGTALSVTGMVLSLLGGTMAAFALLVSIVFLGVSAAQPTASEPAPAPSAGATEGTEGTDGGAGATLTAGEEAFLTDVRPKVNEIMAEIDPTLTPDIIESQFPDEALIMVGTSLLTTGEAGIDPIVDQASAALGDAVSVEQLRAVYEAIYVAAKTNLG